MSISEDELSIWAKAPSESEESKCQNAVDSISAAVHKKFGNGVSVFLQGSYRNRTNVKKDSDVDIIVLNKNHYFPSVGALSEEDKQKYWNSFVPSDYTFENFKSDLHEIIKNEFSFSIVERKNKCIRLPGNSYRVNADVVPAFEYHRYAMLDRVSAIGIGFVPDNDRDTILNSFPNQHYENGVQKNQETEEVFKSVVRILKNIRNRFIDESAMQIEQMPSFFLECLVWNVANNHFISANLKETTKNVISAVWNDMQKFEKSNNYTEVSYLKWLFRGQTKRTPQQAGEFMLKTWNLL